ncbi:MAG: IS200/IS605 family transposase [Nitrospinae bacterium]|nr:IS200/IS605 family transposase [Nitrospinota bacterium]
MHCMGIKATKHAVYDIKYHFVWTPKYRKGILKKEVEKRVKELFEEIARQYEFEIDTMEIMPDHVHVFLTAPPRYSPAKVVNILKGISSRKVFKEYPLLKKDLWGGELWSDGYFVRTVGDKVTADVIRRYINYQHLIEHRQLKLF